MKKICYALLWVLSFALPASADVVFTVVDNDYKNGSAGFIVQNGEGDLQTIQKALVGLNGDHAVLSFNDATGAARVMISQYTFGQPDTVWIYDPATTDFSTPLKAVQWENFSNRRDAASSGNFLYAVCYDNATVVKVDMTNNSYAETAHYTFASAARDYDVHGEAIEVVGDHIYALFTVVKDPWTVGDYRSSVLVKLNQNLEPVASADVGENALKMATYDDKLYIASLGGKQNYGSYNGASSLQMIEPVTMQLTTLFESSSRNSEDAAWKYDFRDIVFSASGDAYILAGAYDSFGELFQGAIYKSTAASLDVSDIGTYFADPAEAEASGYTWELRYDAVMEKLVSLAGYYINIYNSNDGEDYETIKSPALGGNLCSMTVIETPKLIVQSGSSSGGCNAGFAALALLALLPVVKIKKRNG